MKSTSRPKTVRRPRGGEIAGQFSLLFQNNPLPMWVFDRETLRFLDVNEAAVKHYGYARREFLKMLVSDIHPKEDVPLLKAHVRDGRSPRHSGEWRHCKKDGSLIYVEITSRKLTYNGHKGVLVVAKDVTGQMQADQASIEKLAEFAGLIQSAMDAVIIIDHDQRIELFNAAAEKIFRRSAAEVIGRSLGLLMPQRFRSTHKEHVKEFGRSGATQRSVEHPIQAVGLRADGSEFPIEVSISAAEISGKKYYTAILRDVTERKKSEEALRESAAQYRLLFEATPVGIGLVDLSGNLLAFNDAMLRPGGYDREDVWKIGNVKLLYADPAQRTEVLSLFQRQGYVSKYEVQFKRKDGSVYDALLSLAKVDIKGEPCIQALVEDVTEYKRTGQALREAEDRYRMLVERLPMIAYTNVAGDINSTRYVSPQVEAVLGYTPEEWLDDPKFWQKTLHPEDLPRVLAAVQRADQSGELFDAEYRMFARDGRCVWFHDQAVLNADPQGQRLFWHGFMVDITERKQAESELHQRATHDALLVEFSHALAESELDNQAILDTTVRHIAELVGDACVLTLLSDDGEWLRPAAFHHPDAEGAAFLRHLLPAESLRANENLTGQVILSGEPVLIPVMPEEQVRSSINQKYWPYLERFGVHSILIVPLRERGRVIGTLGVTRDKPGRPYNLADQFVLQDLADRVAVALANARLVETIQKELAQRKQAEEALRASEERFRSLYENVTIGLYRTTPDGRILMANPALVKMLGYNSFEELVSRNLEQEGYEPTYPRQKFKELLEKDGEVRGFESAWATKDGDVIYVRESARAIPDPQGHILYYEGTVEDITERKQAEEALRGSEAELRALFASLPDVILVLDEQGRCLKVAPTNPSTLHLPVEDVLGKRMHDIFSRQKADQFLEYIHEALRTRKPVQFEYAWLVRDQIMWFSGATAALTRDTVVWTARDITTQKRAEEQIERRLTELEALHESALSLSQSLDPAEIGRKVIKVLADRLNWHHAAVRVRRGETDQVELLAFSQMEKREETETDYMKVSGAVSRVGEGLSGWVIQHGRMINSGRLEDDPRYHETFPGMRSGLYVPIWAGGRAIGCISVESNQHEAFSDADERLLTTLASQAAAALENARLFEAERLRRQDAETLRQAAAALASSLDPEKILNELLDGLAKVLSYDSSTLFIREKENVRAVSGRGLVSPEKVIGRVFPADDELTQLIWETRRPVILADVQGDPRFIDWGTDEPIRGWMGVPLVVRGEAVGYLTLDSLTADKYTEADAQMALAFATQAAAAIENARLFEETRRSATEFASLYETAHDIAAQQDLNQLLDTIVKRAGALLNAPVSGIYLYDKSHNDLYVAVNRGLPSSLGLRLALGEGVAGRVAESQQPIIVDDYQIWQGHSSKYSGVPIRSVLEVPMLYAGELIGVLTVDELGDSERKFTEADAHLLSLFASHAASAVHSARLFQQNSRRATEFEALYQTASDLSSQTNLQTLLNTIIERAWILTRAAGAGLYLYDPEQDELELEAIHDPDMQPGTRLTMGEGLSGQVAQSKQPMVVNNYQNWQGRSSKYQGIPHTAVIAVPMLYRGELIGVLNVFHRADEEVEGLPPQFSEQDMSLLSLFANAAAGAVYSARLLDETRRRLGELDALAKVSSALRVATTRTEMAPIILTQLREMLHADGALFAALDPATREIVDEQAQGSIEALTGLVVPADQGLEAQVIRSRQVYITSDLHSDPHLFASEPLNNVRCAAIVPLIAQDHDIGALWVTRDQKDGIRPVAFTKDEVNLLVAIADMAANAIQRVSLHERTTHFAEQLVTINAMGHALSQTLDLPSIYEKVSRSVLDLLPDTATVFISLFDPQTKLITAAYGLQDGRAINVAALPPMPFDERGQGNQSQIIHSGQPLIVPDLVASLAGANVVRVKGADEERSVRSALYVPLKAEGRVIGVLQLQSYAWNRYAHEDAELLELVANTAAVTIQNARLFTQLKRRVDQLSALHSVDTAISSTTDLRISLQTVLENITRHLKVDAAAVLLLNPATLTLQHIASEGFLASQIARTSISLGKSQAGVAALERRIVRIPDLAAADVEFAHSSLALAEKFAAYLAVPLIAKGEVKGVLEIFHRTPLNLDEERMSFLEMLAGQAALAIDNALLFEGLERANIELTMAYDATIEGWSQALELRDQETQGHSARVLELTLRLAMAMGVSDKELKDIRRGVLLHDIGKMGIPDSILHKPGPLSDPEWEVMRKHPQYAYDMLAPIAYLHTSLDIPYCHHEKWDGTGYPRALKGETIPLAARLFSVVDVYDALTSDRPYRGAWSQQKTTEYLFEQSGKHFDPRAVEVFLRVIES